MNYTEQANEVLQIAKTIARELDHPYVGTEHLLLGLRKVYTGVAGQVLAANGVDEENILKVVDELVSPVGNTTVAHNPDFSPRLQYILEESNGEALRFRSPDIGTEHLLLALLKEVDCVAARILLTLGISLQKLYQDVLVVLGADPKEYQEDLMQESGRKKEGVLEQYRSYSRGRRRQA
jgi:ATP-dependent Clp protease ATP-binding subunit ClpC